MGGVQRKRLSQRDGHLLADAAYGHQARRQVVQAWVPPHRCTATVPASPAKPLTKQQWQRPQQDHSQSSVGSGWTYYRQDGECQGKRLFLLFHI